MNGARPEVQAAGGVVARPGRSGVEIVVVHRPEYDDWTLPKGKCDEAETLEDCALREVEEETSLRCHLMAPLGTTAYVDRKNRSKEVHWWLMAVDSGRIRGQAEVDRALWATPERALALLSYDRDKELLRPLLTETVVHVVRHGDAGDRSKWTQADELRPLDARGRRQAEALAEVIGAWRPRRLVTSPYQRCVQTLQPAAARLGLPLEASAELAEGNGLDGIGPLLVTGSPVVACTHGDVLEELVLELSQLGLAPRDARVPKACVWTVRAVCGLLRGAEYLPPPA